MELIEMIKVIVLGMIEGVTEWLPISSTGHMILVDEFMQLHVSDRFKEMFFVVIQLGAIMAVVCIFFHKLNPFTSKKTNMEKKDTYVLWFKVAIACIPAGVIGVLFDDKLDEMFYNYQTVAVMLILYGVLFILVENRHKNKTYKITELNQLTYSTAFMIGLFQVLALIPGTSRSGATIIGAMLIGTSRYVAAEFTFFLAIPVMFGASVFKVLKLGVDYTGSEMVLLLIGVVTAFAVSIIAIKFLMQYIKKHDFKVFGYYRISLGAIIFIYFMLMR
ncbi:undecaprenyl-diphosphate phosphatase [Vallitalea pronyensis]|uniref:Undecaprenyl-diphosphatase n=2 Tax=Vallitalea pronyensis TaxID=1348613 RepID=A0A8J8MI16_9FIRM|nr:undecaprenyl-diphosphate phosphatase [Vallitalea pronyensis]QUI21826.1 undecaprenyl-diphosphate phosphatase [Vallitalea pronyensis]